MNKSDHTLHFHDLYVEGIALFLLVVSITVPLCLIILSGYLYWQRKTIRWTFLAILSMLLIGRFLLFYSYQNIETINDTVKVVEVDHYETSSRLTIRYMTHRYHVYVYDDEIELGDYIYIHADVSKYDEAMIPYGFDARNYYLSNNVIGRLDIETLQFDRHGFSMFTLRDSLINHVKTSHQSFVKSFIFGKDQLDDTLSEPFREANLLFLLQTTGLHAYVLVYLMKKLMFYFDMDEHKQNGVTVGVYGLLCYLNGFAIGVVRLLLSQIFNIFNKHYRLRFTPLDRLFIVCFVMVLFAFQWAYSVGLLMTMIILLTLELARDRYQSYQGYMKRLVMSLLIVTACLPFTGMINPLVVLCLPLIIGFVTGLLYPLSFIVYFTTRLDHIFGLMLNSLTWCVNLINSKNLTYYLPSLNQWQILLYYILFIFLLRAYQKHQLLIRAVLLSGLFGFKLVTNRYINDASVYFIDVGQGDTTYIETRSCNVMIDGFSGSVDFLKHHGVNQLDYLFLTHSDDDHTKGAVDIVNQIGVDHIIINPYDDGYEDYQTSIEKGYGGDYISCGDLVFKVLGPMKAYDEANLNSLVIQVDIKGDIYLFTGDISKEVEQDLVNYYGDLLKSDILKIAHHGSTTSSSNNFISYVNPSYGIIFAGRDNHFDFPHQETLKTLIAHRVILYRTDQLGTIMITYKNMRRLWEATLPISTKF